MSYTSSDQDLINSCDESSEKVAGKKSIRKSKQYKKKHQNTVSSSYKKIRCQFYNKGDCTKGTHCIFSHSFIPDIAKKTCKMFVDGNCNKAQCPYSHNTKRYPCKFFHIVNQCRIGEQCIFSHQEIDIDFLDQFLKDNQEFLKKIYKTGHKMPNNIASYIEKNDILNKERKKQVEAPKPSNKLPFIFGFPIYKTCTKEQNHHNESTTNHKNRQSQKSQASNEQPFSIRLVHKNRSQIPQRLQLIQKPLNHKPQEYPIYSDKISQGIQLTPQSKYNQCQPVQQYMCSNL